MRVLFLHSGHSHDVHTICAVSDGWEELADSRTRKRKPADAAEDSEFDGRIVVDMREFRSKLPSLLYQVL